MKGERSYPRSSAVVLARGAYVRAVLKTRVSVPQPKAGAGTALARQGMARCSIKVEKLCAAVPGGARRLLWGVAAAVGAHPKAIPAH